jgi:hypothetical protein
MNATEIQDLRAKFRGELIVPGDAGYDAARKVYNAMIDRRPALIVKCADVADVIAAVTLAREKNLLLAVRGGGHNGPGLGVCDGGLVIDLSRLRGIRVDQQSRSVRVEGGCLWGDVDHATHPFGLAVPSGFLSTTGVGGLTLGGGIGLPRPPARPHDRQPARRRRRARGRPAVTASAEENADLFWAVRGGGGNFGVVTSFLFRAHPVQNVYGGPIFWPIEKGPELLRFWRDFILKAPEDINGWVRLCDRAAGCDVPGRAPDEEGVRRHLVLHGRSGEGRGGVQADPRLLAAAHGLLRPDPVPGAAEPVRRPLPRRAAVVLEGRLLPGALRQGDRAAPEVRRAAADATLDDAHLPDQRRGGAAYRRPRPPSTSATRSSPRSSWASTRIRRATRASCSGRRTTGSRSTRSRRAAATST